jgi:dienelactone hydrolase
MNNLDVNISISSSYVDHIPLIWITPDKQQQSTRLAIWLPGGTGKKEDTLPRLQQLARAGFVAISFDPWQHGERGTGESAEQMFTQAMRNFSRTVWPILGQSALDTLRVIDWAIDEFDGSPPCYMGGESLGGDIAVAAAGIDSRIGCASAIIATPDWCRPGMHAWGQLVQPGPAGGYAQFFYDHINPLTNLSGYAHCPAITFECGAEDDHVPSDGALRFQMALQQTYQSQPDRLRVNLHSGVAHQVTPTMWQNSLEWFLQH